MANFRGKTSWIFLLGHLFCQGQTTTIKVIGTFGDGSQSYGLSRQRDFATVSEDPVSNLPSKITICASLSTPSGPNILGFYQLLDDEGSPVLSTQLFNFKRSPVQKIKLVGGPNDKVFDGEIDMIPMQRYWVHSCTYFDSDSGNVVVIVNGKTVIEATISPVKLPKSLKNNLWFGDLWIGLWYTTRGMVANLNVYSRQLSEEVMIDKTSGSGCGVSDGDYLSWSDIQLSLEGEAAWSSISVPELCQKESSLVVFTEIMLASSCINLCPKMQRGQAARVITTEDKERLRSYIKEISFINGVDGPRTQSGIQTSATWLAMTRVGDEWVDWFNRSIVIEGQTWGKGQPETGQDCALYTAETDSWYSSDCNFYGQAVSICPCLFPETPLLTLRGLCAESNLDKTLFPQNHFTNGTTSHYGFLKTELNFNNNAWRMQVYNSPTSAYTKEASANTFALGKYNWMIEGDHQNCNEGKPHSRLLKLTGCREGEFTCSEGQCVKMEQRCDQISNCRDESDESGCQLMVIKDSYNKKVPPINVNGDEILPVEVNVTLVLMKITDIIETKHKIQLQFGIQLKWFENRAKFHNLKSKRSLNALSDKEIENMWLPFVIYDNTDQKEAVRLMEGVKTTVTVSREGRFVRSGTDVADEIEVFEGNPKSLLGGNYVEMRQTYSKEFQCEYQLQRYPFDVQVCSIDLAVMELQVKTIKLVPEDVIMKSKKELTMYIITSYSIQYRNNSDSEDGIKMQITLKRRIVNEVLTTYLPSVLLILITYATTYFKSYYFEAALTGNLTTMLVMTTIFVAVMDKLPSTAYVKFVDIWLILGQLIPFSEVCLITALEVFRDGDGTGTVAINHHGQPRTISTNKADPEKTSLAEVGPSWFAEDAQVSETKRRANYVFYLKTAETIVIPICVVIGAILYTIIAVLYYQELL